MGDEHGAWSAKHGDVAQEGLTVKVSNTHAMRMERLAAFLLSSEKVRFKRQSHSELCRRPQTHDGCSGPLGRAPCQRRPDSTR